MKNAILFIGIFLASGVIGFGQTTTIKLGYSRIASFNKKPNNDIHFILLGHDQIGIYSNLYSYNSRDTITQICRNSDGEIYLYKPLTDTSFLYLTRPSGAPGYEYRTVDSNCYQINYKYQDWDDAGYNRKPVIITADKRLFTFNKENNLIQYSTEWELLQSHSTQHLNIGAINKISHLDDNHFLITDFNNQQFVNIDALGNAHWIRTFSEPINGDIIAHKFFKKDLYFLTKDEHYTLTGIDSLGNTIFKSEIKDTCSQCTIRSFIATEDDNFYLLGKVNHWGKIESEESSSSILRHPNDDLLLIKLASDGNLEWMKMRGEELFDELSFGEELPGDSLIFGGYLNGYLYPNIHSPGFNNVTETSLIFVDKNASDWKDLEYLTPPLDPLSDDSYEHNIAPNPVDDHLTIKTFNNHTFVMNIYNAGGYLMEQLSFSRKLEINLSAYPTGLYFYELSIPEDAKGRTTTGRFMVY